LSSVDVATAASLPTPTRYRLVVVASKLQGNGFIWVIVDDIYNGIPAETSQRTFRSTGEAYNARQGALVHWQRKDRAA
jgi:hypothetical protein